MGCVSSRPEFPNDVHPNVFTVTTVSRPNSARDSCPSARGSSMGQLEVTSNEIILHRRGHDAVNWPLQYIRRYGCENHLFSFESGRRCESGPGIFTFRCRRARELFLLVQSNVQDARTHPSTTTTAALAGRLRSESATSQSQIIFPPALNSGSSLGRRSLNDYLTSERQSSLLTTNSSTVNGNPQMTYPNSASPSPRTGSARVESGGFDDIDSGQVFEEITPLRSSLTAEQKPRSHNNERRHRLSSTRSQTSSAASDHSLQQNRSRPISFELVLSGTSSPPDGDSNAFVSPQPSNPSPSASPPSFAYYVNVEPPSTTTERRPRNIDSQRHLSAERQSDEMWRPPARSHSLGSPNIAQPPQYFESTSGNYVNIVHGGSRSPSVASKLTHDTNKLANDTDDRTTLDYVTLDISGSGAASFPSAAYLRSPRRQYARTSCINGSPFDPTARASFFGSSLTSVTEVGSVKSDDEKKDQSSTASNYARIDCTRTKALRETAAAAQMQRHSTSCSVSSSSEATIYGGDQVLSMGRRSRHESTRTSTTDKPYGVSSLSASTSKHIS